MKYLFLITIIMFSTFIGCVKETYIPMAIYQEEISKLKTETDIKKYWQKLSDFDQEMLKLSKSTHQIDSSSITNMIPTALLYETHGSKIFTPEVSTPIFNLSHNYWVNSTLAFWPIIKEYSKINGMFRYLKYQLENVSMCLYDYSLLGQDSISPKLLNNLNAATYTNKVSTNLINIYKAELELRNLSIKGEVGKWKRKSFKSIVNERLDYFEILKMSDNQIYLKRKERLIRLVLIDKINSIKTYKIKNDPFGWYYQLNLNGQLSLMNDKDAILIQYEK